jgi:hypothetical protein
MSHHARLAIAAFAAALCVAAVADSAIASRGLEIRGGEISSESSEMTYTTPENIRIRCNTTFRGTLGRQIVKERGSHVGQYRFASTARCTSTFGEAAIRFLGPNSELTYQGFGGSLPNIQWWLYNVVQLEFLVDVRLFGLPYFACLYRGELGISVSAAGGETEVLAEPGFALIQQLAGSGACPRVVVLSGAPSMEPIQRARLI